MKNILQMAAAAQPEALVTITAPYMDDNTIAAQFPKA